MCPFILYRLFMSFDFMFQIYSVIFWNILYPFHDQGSVPKELSVLERETFSNQTWETMHDAWIENRK